jgi:hypothetical protein
MTPPADQFSSRAQTNNAWARSPSSAVMRNASNWHLTIIPAKSSAAQNHASVQCLVTAVCPYRLVQCIVSTRSANHSLAGELPTLLVSQFEFFYPPPGPRSNSSSSWSATLSKSSASLRIMVTAVSLFVVSARARIWAARSRQCFGSLRNAKLISGRVAKRSGRDPSLPDLNEGSVKADQVPCMPPHGKWLRRFGHAELR